MKEERKKEGKQGKNKVAKKEERKDREKEKKEQLKTRKSNMKSRKTIKKCNSEGPKMMEKNMKIGAQGHQHREKWRRGAPTRGNKTRS